jgi:PAS domain S-box-containing protein
LSRLLGLSSDLLLGRHHQALFGSLDVPRPSVLERSLIAAEGDSRRIRWSITPKFDAAGRPSGMSCAGIELAPEIAEEDEVEALMSRTSDGVFLINGDGRIERINRAAAQMFGVEEHEAVGTSVTGLMPDRYREHHAGNLSSYRASHGENPARAVIGMRSDGAEFPLTLRVEEVKSDDGRRFVGFARETAEDDSPRRFEDRQTKHLQTLRDVLRATSGVTPLELTRVVLPRIADLMGASAAAVALNIEDETVVEFFGLPSETAALVKDLLVSGDVDPATLRALTRMHVLAKAPLKGTARKLGLVLLFSRQDAPLDGERSEVLESLTRSLCVALENFMMTREIENAKASRDSAHESILRAMVAALELRDHETEGHTQRVTRLSVQLGEALGLEGEELRNLEHGALLHDIGKIGIPDAILHKPGPLTAPEWEVMRKHPQYAYDILAPLPHLSHALDVPYCHHERYDGSGYPRGLRGPEIPLAARIFAVVDVFDAMTTERPYRPALPEDYAVAHLKSHSGTHFDPVVIQAFCGMVESLPTTETVQG